MNKKVLDKLTWDAHNITWNFINNGFNIFNGSTNLGAYTAGDDKYLTAWDIQVSGGGNVKFTPKGKPNGSITFTGVQPKTPTDIVYQPAVIQNKKTDGVYTIQTTNESGAPVTRKFTLSASNETSQSQAVGVGISATIGASVTVGSTTTMGYEANLSVSSTISADYSKNWGSSEVKTEARELTVDVAPRSIMFIDLTKSTGDYSQKTDCNTVFDYGITMTDGNETLKFSNIDEMMLYAQGYGDSSDPTNGWLTKSGRLLNPSQLANFSGNFKAKPVQYSYINKFKGASVGEVKVRETDLNNKGFKYNA